jgi:hypothetical protein
MWHLLPVHAQAQLESWLAVTAVSVRQCCHCCSGRTAHAAWYMSPQLSTTTRAAHTLLLQLTQDCVKLVLALVASILVILILKRSSIFNL